MTALYTCQTEPFITVNYGGHCLKTWIMHMELSAFYLNANSFKTQCFKNHLNLSSALLFSSSTREDEWELLQHATSYKQIWMLNLRNGTASQMVCNKRWVIAPHVLICAFTKGISTCNGGERWWAFAYSRITDMQTVSETSTLISFHCRLRQQLKCNSLCTSINRCAVVDIF